MYLYCMDIRSVLHCPAEPIHGSPVMVTAVASTPPRGACFLEARGRGLWIAEAGVASSLHVHVHSDVATRPDQGDRASGFALPPPLSNL